MREGYGVESGLGIRLPFRGMADCEAVFYNAPVHDRKTP